MKSILWSVGKEELFDVANNSKSINEILRHFGLSGSAFYTLKSRLIQDGFDLTCFSNRTKMNRSESVISNPDWKPKPLSEYMIENSSYSRKTLKSRIIKEGLLPYKCNVCKCDPVWNGEPLVLILDHINGIRNDHRKENLRFLCPNCNSQTITFAGRNNKNKGKKCSCGKAIWSQSNRCEECYAFESRKVSRPTAEELQKLLWEMPIVKIAMQYGVSNNTVLKWSKSYGLTRPQQGYWKRNISS